MIYPCVVKNAKGKVKRRYSREELTLKHWGADRKCKGCGMLFKTKLKVGKKDGVKPNPNSPEQFIPNLVPDLDYHSTACRWKSHHAANKKPKKVIMEICDVCQTPFQRVRKGHLRCSRKCRKVINRARNREADRIRKATKRAQERLQRDEIIITAG